MDSPPKRRWYQYRLRTLLIFVTLVAMVVGSYFAKVRRQKAALEAVKRAGGEVSYRAKTADDQSRFPPWLLDVIGYDDSWRVQSVVLGWVGRDHTARKTDGQLLRYLNSLPNLEDLAVCGLTDDGLRYVAQLENLKGLAMCHASVSDRGIRLLSGLKKLNDIRCDSAQITDDSLAVFASLPDLEHLEAPLSRFTDRGVSYLTRLKKLKFLDLESCQLGEEGSAAVATISSLERLSIGYGGRRITDNELRELGKLKRVWNLTLKRAIITQDVAPQIAELPCSFINLSSGYITDTVKEAVYRETVKRWKPEHYTTVMGEVGTLPSPAINIQ